MSVPETPHGPRPPRNKGRRKSYRIDPKFQNRFRAAMLAFAVVILLLAQLTSLGVAYAHRLCGPVFIMRRTLEAVRRGERPEPIQLRRKDEFRELADALNETLLALDAMDEKAEERTL
jgi:nitrogen fixation/metabolism regulation signal transduction histidine kinase